jgi:hypothetical protein
MFCRLKVGASLSLVRRRARKQAGASSAGRAAIARGIAPTPPVLIMAVFTRAEMKGAKILLTKFH